MALDLSVVEDFVVLRFFGLGVAEDFAVLWFRPWRCEGLCSALALDLDREGFCCALTLGFDVVVAVLWLSAWASRRILLGLDSRLWRREGFLLFFGSWL